MVVSMVVMAIMVAMMVMVIVIIVSARGENQCREAHKKKRFY